MEICPIALSDTQTSNRLIITDDKNTGRAALKDANTRDRNVKHEYIVETKRLTDILDQENIINIDLLKIDVEGAETNVLRDLDGQLNNIGTILVEFHTNKLRAEEIKEAFEILNDSGEVTDLDGDVVELSQILEKKMNIIWQSD